MKDSVVSPRTQVRFSARTALCLWLIRHAEVEARYQSVFGGTIDMELSPRGHDQANALAKYLRDKSFDAVYASPMRRVQQTIAPLLKQGLPRPTVVPELREVDFGDWTGLAWDEVHARFSVSPFSWLDQLECAAIPNAECGQTFRARVEPWLRAVMRDRTEGQVAIICHGGVIRMMLSILLDLPLSRMASFEIDYASITQVALQPLKPRIQLLNFAPWRDLP